MQIALIYAVAANGVIGRNGTMPWHLPEDLAHFRALTSGSPVIMGRKTWESLPERFRPLPGRANVVITRQLHWQAPGAQVVHSLEQALDAARATQASTVWVMGGAQIYTQALPLADRVEVTHIQQAFEGDAYAPTLGPEWQAQEQKTCTSAQGVELHFVRYVKTKNSATP